MIFMIISSLPFILIFQSVRKNILDFLKTLRLNFFYFYFGIIVVIMFWLTKYYEVDYFQSLRIASFSVISIATGSGFSTYDFSTLGNICNHIVFIYHVNWRMFRFI